MYYRMLLHRLRSQVFRAKLLATQEEFPVQSPADFFQITVLALLTRLSVSLQLNSKIAEKWMSLLLSAISRTNF